MPNWKKVLLNGNGGSLSTLSLTGLSAQNSETDVLTINGSNVVGTRTLGSNAFTSTTIGTTTNNLTVDNSTLVLNTGTTFNGSGARTISAKTAAITETGTGLATAAQIYTFVTGLGYTTNTGTVTEVTVGTGLDITNPTSTPAISLDLSELTDMIEEWQNNTDEFIVLDNGTQKRKLSNEIFGSNAFTSTSIPTAASDIGALAASNNLSDVANAATARSNIGAYGVASTIQATAGSAASPAYTFFTDQNSGFFKSGDDVIGASAGGSKVLDISSEGITVYGDIVKNGGTSTQFLKADGSVDSTTYLSSLTGAVLTSGNQSASGTKTFTGQIKIGASGTTTAPMILFPGDEDNTGFYSSGTDEIAITRLGSQALKIDEYGLQVALSGTSQFSGHLQAHCLGIGTSPSTTQGEIRATGDIIANYSSDRRLKKYIKNIPNALEKVSQINGVTFEWKKTDEKMKKEIHSHEGPDVGVIAQEVEEVLPEVVSTRDNGYKAVNYEKIVPLLIEAIKDLKAEIDELKKSK